MVSHDGGAEIMTTGKTKDRISNATAETMEVQFEMLHFVVCLLRALCSSMVILQLCILGNSSPRVMIAASAAASSSSRASTSASGAKSLAKRV